MLIFLPLVSFVVVFLALGNVRRAWGWGRTLLRSLVLLGTYMVLGTELLSLLKGITPLGISLMWLGPIGVGAFALIRWRRRGERLVFPVPRIPKAWPDRVLLAVVTVIAIVTALVAWLAPPQTWDSLAYHTARVAHWAQNRSVAHYATGIERQNYMSPGAELAVLQTYVLSGNDRLVNFVQWGSMIASLLGASLLAYRLGAGSTGRWFSAAFISTLPMGISQASSTMTDYFVALWVIISAFESVCIIRDEDPTGALPFLGLAIGLAILSKPTALGYLLPLAVYVGASLLLRKGIAMLARSTAIVVLLGLSLDGGYFGRNLVTYGHPFADRSRMFTHANEVLDLSAVFSNTLRNASLHMGTPWESVNRQILRLIVGLHVKLGMDVSDPRTSFPGDFRVVAPNPDEATSGNSAHAFIVACGAVLVILLVLGRKMERGLLMFLVVAAASFTVLSAMFKFTVFGSRYHVPFFVLIAPGIAVMVERLLPRAWVAILGVMLLIGARDWLLELSLRPIVVDRIGRSVLTTDRMSLYLLPGTELPYRRIATEIRNSSCRSVGLMLNGDAQEYPLWVYLGAPRSDLTIEWIVAGTPSERYRIPGFAPCAVVCDASCSPEWTTVSDLPLRLELTGYRLYQSR